MRLKKETHTQTTKPAGKQRQTNTKTCVQKWRILVAEKLTAREKEGLRYALRGFHLRVGAIKRMEISQVKIRQETVKILDQRRKEQLTI
jgi:hypothetical protein